MNKGVCRAYFFAAHRRVGFERFKIEPAVDMCTIEHLKVTQMLVLHLP